MSDNRTEFISHLSRCLGRTEVPAKPSAMTKPNAIQHEYLKGSSAEEMFEVFVKNARAAGTAVSECAPAAINATLLAAIAQLAAGPILLTDDPVWEVRQTAAALRQVHGQVHVWDTTGSREDNIARAEGAAVGLAVANLALAETGTVMVYGQRGCGRSVTLLPKTTIFVIPKENIRPRLTQAMAYLEEEQAAGLPPAILFISAASSTADIELVRVQGVHGPVKIAYLIVG